jgi:hypothetical protein
MKTDTTTTPDGDLLITCCEAGCGEQFLFTVSERAWLEARIGPGLVHTPRRCKRCRAAKRARFNDWPEVR